MFMARSCVAIGFLRSLIGWQWGTFYWYDGEGLIRHTTLPNVVHSWGAWYDEESEQIYVAVGLHDGKQESFSGGVFVTETSGETWRLVADGSQGVGLYRTYDVLGFGGRLYALTNDALGSPCNLAVSADKGQSWLAVVDAPGWRVHLGFLFCVR